MKEPIRQTNATYLPVEFPLQVFFVPLTESSELHWHEFFELMFVLSGIGVNQQNGINYPIGRGSLFLQTPADFHRLIVIPGETLFVCNVIFPSGLLEDGLYQTLLGRDYHFITRLAEVETMEAEMNYRLIETELNGRKWGSHYVLKGTLESLVVRLIRECLSAENSLKAVQSEFQFTFLHQSLNHIHTYFRDPLTLKQAAGKAGLSSSYFSRCFRENVGVSFQSYLQEVRLQFAKSMLTASIEPITEVCYASGFQTLSHFERVFRKKFGQTPRGFRRLLV